MSIAAQATAPDGALLSPDRIRETLYAGLGGRFANACVLVLIPDHTRTIPLPMLFRLLVDELRAARQLDFIGGAWHAPAAERRRAAQTGRHYG